MLFLVELATSVPAELDASARQELIAAESAAGAEHVRAGRLIHIWRIPGQQANVAIWNCADADELHAALTGLPAWPWMTVTVRALATHPLSPT